MAERVFNVTNLVCRNDISLNWKIKNPVLKKGELGLEVDTTLMKIGDGSTAWNSLDYSGVTALTTDDIDDLFANA